MRPARHAAALAVAIALGACGRDCAECVPNPSAIPHADLLPGAACLAGSSCAAGLECVQGRVWGSCSRACSGDPSVCPAASTCDLSSGQCFVPCSTDADCAHTYNAVVCRCAQGRCSCGMRTCSEDGDCPGGARCVEGETLGNLHGMNPNCDEGFCQARP